MYVYMYTLCDTLHSLCDVCMYVCIPRLCDCTYACTGCVMYVYVRLGCVKRMCARVTVLPENVTSTTSHVKRPSYVCNTK